MASKALTLPLQKLLPQRIHVDQYADKEGRTMVHAINTIENIIQNIKGQQMCGLMVAFNFNSREPLILSAEHSYWFTDQGLVFL